MKNRLNLILLVAALLIGNFSRVADAVRMKDIAYLQGARNNQLLGYGIVVGLSGTGDARVDLTDISLMSILKNLGVDLRSKGFQSKNIAAVLCSANLPPFSRVGATLDLTVSSIGTATSLDGGNLLMTPLRGPDGSVYAMGQGKIITVRRNNERSAAVTGQTMVTALVPRGALLEKEIKYEYGNKGIVHYYLNQPDFTTAARAAKRLNEELGGRYATASDAGTIDVVLPAAVQGNAVDFISQIEGIEVESDRKAKVVINQRTGTVILGDQVRISPVAIAHNNLRIEIKKEQAAAEEEKPPETAPGKESQPPKHQVMMINSTTTISDVVSSLNEMGVTPDDLIFLLHALKSAGALAADLEVQ